MKKSFENGQSLYDRGNYRSAANLYKQIVIGHPDNLSAHLGLSRCLLKLDRISEAENDIQTILSVNPNLSTGYILLGLVCEKKEKYVEAEKNYRKAIQLDPHDKEAFNVLGAFLLRKDTKESIKYLTKSVELDSTYWPAYFNLAILCDLEKEYKKSLKYSLEVLKYNRSFDNILWIVIRWFKRFPKLSSIIMLSVVLIPIIARPDSIVIFYSLGLFFLVFNLILYVRLKLRGNFLLAFITILIMILYFFTKVA